MHRDEVEAIAREVAQSVVNDLRMEVDSLRIDMEMVDNQLSDSLVNSIKELHIKINKLHPKQ